MPLSIFASCNSQHFQDYRLLSAIGYISDLHLILKKFPIAIPKSKSKGAKSPTRSLPGRFE